jgi:hypothetical protein
VSPAMDVPFCALKESREYRRMWNLNEEGERIYSLIQKCERCVCFKAYKGAQTQIGES